MNRVDETIVFHQLAKEHLYDIVEIEIQDIRERLEQQGLKLELSQEAIDFLIEKGFDPVYGARPLRRVLQKYVENVLSEDILGRKFESGHKIKAIIVEDKLCFEQIDGEE